MRKSVLGTLCLLVVLTVTAAAQDNAMTLAPMATSKFVNMPGLPTCMKIAVQRGDPSKGPSTLLLKFTPGCVVPWHWHTAGENLMVVSGSGKAEMKDGKPTVVKSGDYAYLPSKLVHQFTAITAVTMFDMPDAAFDIHYVDQSGKEIPPDEALKSAKKTAAPMKKPMTKQ
jgi:quercetin dioxygenase-like cupin family protein